MPRRFIKKLSLQIIQRLVNVTTNKLKLKHKNERGRYKYIFRKKIMLFPVDEAYFSEVNA